MLTWEHSGFNVHLSDRISNEGLRDSLEYLFRPAYSVGRLKYDGRRLIIFPLKGSSSPPQILSPFEAISRLLKLIRPPRIHRHRAWGKWARNIRFRDKPEYCQDKEKPPARRRMWRDLISRS